MTETTESSAIHPPPPARPRRIARRRGRAPRGLRRRRRRRHRRPTRPSTTAAADAAATTDAAGTTASPRPPQSAATRRRPRRRRDRRRCPERRPTPCSRPPTSPRSATCLVLPELTEGPFPTIEQIERRDITEGRAGLPLRVGVQVVDESCVPIPGATVEIWHCDIDGDYSAYADGYTDDDGGEGTTFLRGSQVANADGIVEFLTVYPGWYAGPGRAHPRQGAHRRRDRADDAVPVRRRAEQRGDGHRAVRRLTASRTRRTTRTVSPVARPRRTASSSRSPTTPRSAAGGP